MDSGLYSQLVDTLLKIPAIDDFDTRTALLAEIPNQQSLNRNDANTRADIILLINQLEQIHLQTGESALLIFITNADSLVQGFNVSIELANIRKKIEISLSLAWKNEPSEQPQPPLQSTRVPAIPVTSAQLREAMKSAYDLGGLEILCADLNIHYGSLGEGAIDVKIQRLINYVQQHGRYEELVQKILEDRPHLRQLDERADQVSGRWVEKQQGSIYIARNPQPVSPSARINRSSTSSQILSEDSSEDIFQVKSKLTKLLLKCSSIRDREIRNTIMQQLPDQLLHSIPRHPTNYTDVFNIVEKCLEFPGGLQKLIDRLRYFEGGSFQMQGLDDFLKNTILDY